MQTQFYFHNNSFNSYVTELNKADFKDRLKYFQKHSISFSGQVKWFSVNTLISVRSEDELNKIKFISFCFFKNHFCLDLTLTF